jgi:hypothetical protein
MWHSEACAVEKTTVYLWTQLPSAWREVARREGRSQAEWSGKRSRATSPWPAPRVRRARSARSSRIARAATASPPSTPSGGYVSSGAPTCCSPGSSPRHSQPSWPTWTEGTTRWCALLTEPRWVDHAAPTGRVGRTTTVAGGPGRRRGAGVPAASQQRAAPHHRPGAVLASQPTQQTSRSARRRGDALRNTPQG